ncbi:protein-L-isoaspartate O-methyltransferase [Nanoarchaeota archaeon]
MKKQMLESVRYSLSQFGKPNKKVLEAIEKVDRIDFIEDKESAYEDIAIPITHSQTISQPSTVARMLSLLEIKKSDKILEIGTGSLWNAALLGYLGKEVTTLETIPELAKNAEEKTKKLKLKNIRVRNKDFRTLEEKFDKVIFTAGVTYSLEAIIENFAHNHLNENGILICPYRSGPLVIFKMNKGKLEKKYTEEHYVFVPLVL